MKELMKKLGWLLIFVYMPLSEAQFEGARPSIVNGDVVYGTSPAQKQLLLNSVVIGKAPIDRDGNPELDRFKPTCSGTLTAKAQVSTAVHCFSTETNWAYFVEVRTSIHPDKRKKIRVKSVKTSMDIPKIMEAIGKDNDNRGHDLAVLNLAEEVENKNVAPLCKMSPTIQSPFLVAGFGVTEDPTADRTTLRSTSVQMQEIKDRFVVSQPIKDQKQFSTSCFGDSGGGLFIEDKIASRVCLAGVVSGNDSKDRMGSSLSPAEICARPNIRQIFARTTPEQYDGLNTLKEFPENPNEGESSSGGSGGNRGGGNGKR